MANSIDLVVGSEAIKQVENLISKLTVADAELLKISQSAREASKGITAISTPSGLDKAVSNTSALNKELERQNTIIKSLESQIKNLSAVRQSNNKQSAEEAVNQRILNQNALAQAKATSALVGEYQKLDLEHKKALQNAQNLGAKYGETSIQFLKAAEKANTLDTKLKAIDSSLGKNQRNVGNYASGFNALGNSINQLTREAPAFANSMQTGFMAISNNFAALQDAIRGIIEQNKILRAEGKPTVSVFSSLIGATFSWTTAISIGVTLLTVYGAKLVDLALGLGDVEKELKSIEISQKKWNTAVEQANATLDHNLKLEKDRLKLAGASVETIASAEEEIERNKLKNFEVDRDRAKREYDEAVSNALKRKKLEKDKFADIDLTNQTAQQRALILAKKKNFDEQKEEEKNSNEIVKARKKAFIEAENLVKEQGKKLSEFISGQKVVIDEANKEESEKQQKANDERLANLAELRRKELELQLANIDTHLNNDDLYYTERLGALDKDFLKRVEIAKADYDEEFRLAKGSQEKQKTALINYQLEKIKLLEGYNKKRVELEGLALTSRGTTSTNLDPNKALEESAKNAQKGLLKVQEQLKNNEIAAEQAQKAMEGYLNSFSAEFINNSGFTETFKMLNDDIVGFGEDFSVTFNAIAESAQEAFNFISGLSQANFEQEYSRLENQKDVALQFAGDSASARAKIEEDTEKKKKEIANRENKAKQKQAIFNIAIDTAQAIMGLWKDPGFPQAIPLAIAVGALGAVQIAAVASQKIPQYWEGTDNHSGGLMLVNDGKGSNYQEKVILPNGNEILPQGRNVLMNAPKGTRVLTHEQQIQEMLNERGISMSKSSVYNGMTASEMDSIMSKHFANIQTNVTNIDEKGFRNWSERNGNKTIRNEVRASRTGFKV